MFVGDKNTTNNVKCKISDKVEYIRRTIEWGDIHLLTIKNGEEIGWTVQEYLMMIVWKKSISLTRNRL